MLRRKWSAFGLSLLLVLLTLLLANPSPTQTAIAAGEGSGVDWRIECIDCGPTFVAPPIGAATAGQGVTHVFYGGEALYHSWSPGDGWQSEIVYDELGAGEYSQAAVGDDGTLHVIFTHHDQLLYGFQEPDQPWEISPVTGYDWAVVDRFELELGAADQPVLAYYDAQNEALRLAQRIAAAWQHETVVDRVLKGFSLTSDSESRPVLTYYDVTNQLFWGYLAATWQWEQILEVPAYNGSQVLLAVALDSLDRPAIAIEDQLFWQVDDSWLIQDIPANDSYFKQGLDLLFDRDGVLWLSLSLGIGGCYPCGARSYIFLYKWTNEGWSTLLDGQVGIYGSLVMRADGVITLIYSEGRFESDSLSHTTMRIMEATANPVTSSWSASPIVEGVDSGENAVLDLHSRSFMYVLSRNQHRYALRLNTHNHRQWSTTEAEVGAGTSVVRELAFSVGVDGIAHQLYSVFCRVCPNIRYRYGAGAAWQTVDLDVYGQAFDLVVDQAQQPRIALLGNMVLSNQAGILYGIVDPASPYVFTYEQVVGSFRHTQLDLALATDDTPHMVWDVFTSSLVDTKLTYAVRSGNEWEIIPLSERGIKPKLDLDSQDNPHVIFFRENALMYTYRDGASWQEEPVADLTVPGTFAAIAVGPDGVIHVAYQDPVARALVYARRQNGVWQSWVVDGHEDTGWYADIAVDEFGDPHIAYMNADRRDLMYATLSPPLHWLYLPAVR